MKTTSAPLLALALSLGLVPAGALAQSSPAPAAPPPSPMSEPAATAAPAMTGAPAPATAAPPAQTMAPAPAPSAKAGTTNGGTTNGGTTTGTGNNNGKHLGQIKKIPSGSMSTSDLRYALTHPLQEANKVRAMKHVSFDKLRVYRLSTGLKTMLKVSDANADIPVLAILGPGVEVAQTTGLPGTNGSNSPIAYLQYVLANINVSNALNNVNVLNNSTVNVGVSLQDVLNGNKISIGQVAGIFVNGLGIITTITK